jgi:hypothetical protein
MAAGGAFPPGRIFDESIIHSRSFDVFIPINDSSRLLLSRREYAYIIDYDRNDLLPKKNPSSMGWRRRLDDEDVVISGFFKSRVPAGPGRSGAYKKWEKKSWNSTS